MACGRAGDCGGGCVGVATTWCALQNGKGRKGTKGALGDLKAVRQGLQGIEKRLHRDVLQPAANGS